MFTAGQIPAISGLDDQPDTFEDQVRQTIINLRSVLEAAGSGLEHVVKVNGYLTDPDRLEAYNRVYSEFFGAAKPARTTVCVSLWGVALEIDCVAVVAGADGAGRSVSAVNAGLSRGLSEGLAAVSYPTIGHFLEDGFVDPAIRSLLDGVKVAGPAVTVRIADNDAYAMNRALLELYPGAVLVVDMSGDHRHAPVGAVTAAAATAQGAAGVVVDGVATDILELRATGLPVFARGTSCLTTKRVRSGGSAVNVPVQCGGVQVNPGDWVLGDDNGVIVLSPEAAADVLGQALASDAAEPALLARIAAGEPLESVLAI